MPCLRDYAPPLAPFTLQGTENLAIFAKGISQPVISVEASDPAGTEICEFHGTSAIGCVPDGTGVSLVKSPGGDLGTLLIVLHWGSVATLPSIIAQRGKAYQRNAVFFAQRFARMPFTNS